MISVEFKNSCLMKKKFPCRIGVHVVWFFLFHEATTSYTRCSMRIDLCICDLCLNESCQLALGPVDGGELGPQEHRLEDYHSINSGQKYIFFFFLNDNRLFQGSFVHTHLHE